MSRLRELGLQLDRPRRPLVTRFSSAGNTFGLHNCEPLRDAYRHIDPTILGWLAGIMRLLRDPFFMHTLALDIERSKQPSIFGQLIRRLGADLAAVYGDARTVRGLRAHYLKTHSYDVHPTTQPEWFVAARGGTHESFSPIARRFQEPRFLAVADTVARTHELCGLFSPDDEIYYLDLRCTIGFIPAVFTHTKLNGVNLNAMAKRYDGITLMGPKLLRRAGVLDKWLPELLSSDIGDGRTVGSLAPLFTGLMFSEDRIALGFENWTGRDEARLQKWAERYRGQNARLLQREAGMHGGPRTARELNRRDLFVVARRGK